MADTENTPTAHETAASAIDFDTWRQAINASMESYRKYLGLSKGKPYSLPIVAEEIGAEFPELVNHLLEGIDPASPMAKDIRDALSFAHDICQDPWRAAFVTWAKDSNALRTLIAKAKDQPAQFTYHGFIGDLCEAYGQALAAKGEHQVHSPYFNPDAANEVHYKTRLSDGTWQDISQDELLALARDPNGPQIVYSANHAFLDNQKTDLDGLQDQFSRLFDGSRLPVERGETSKDSGHLTTSDKPALGPTDTITVFATHTRENRFLNLAQLFKRLNEVDAHQNDPQNDRFTHLAPIAAATVETLLKSVVAEQDIAHVHYSRDAAGKAVFFDQPVTLRPDAIDVIRRQRYRGFSKGGNDFRDAMRLLVHTLDAKDADGKPQVHVPEGFTTKDLISNISMIVFGLNEKPMADFYREHGVQVPIVSSKNDITAPIPPFAHDEREPVYNYHGGAKRDADGNLADDGHSPKYSVDGMLADWRIHDLLRMHGAVSQGQAAITDINFLVKADGSYDDNALTLNVAHGTTDEKMQQALVPLRQALDEAGLTGTQLERVGSGQGRDRYRLVNHDTGMKLVTSENIEKLQTVLRSISATHNEKTAAKAGARPEMPLWVSEAAAYEQISGIKRYLVLEQKGKLDQKTPYPVTVIDPASVTERTRFSNHKDVREHPRTERNLSAHGRIARGAGGEPQIG
jgi:hypothetical protein